MNAEVQGTPALITAANYGYTDIVRLLLEKGADVNARGNDGQTALMKAGRWFGTTDTILLLIEKGADVTEALNCGKDNTKQRILDAIAEHARQPQPEKK